MIAEPRKIDFENKTLIGDSGKEYRVLGSLSVDRYIEMLKLEPEVGFGQSFESVFEFAREVYDTVNKGRGYADIGVKAHDLMSGIINIRNNRVAVLDFCAIWIVGPDEDPNSIDSDVQEAKIKDWGGVDIESFFIFAGSMLAGFKKNYAERFQSTLNQKKNGTKKEGA